MKEETFKYLKIYKLRDIPQNIPFRFSPFKERTPLTKTGYDWHEGKWVCEYIRLDANGYLRFGHNVLRKGNTTVYVLSPYTEKEFKEWKIAHTRRC